MFAKQCLNKFQLDEINLSQWTQQLLSPAGRIVCWICLVKWNFYDAFYFTLQWSSSFKLGLKAVSQQQGFFSKIFLNKWLNLKAAREKSLRELGREKLINTTRTKEGKISEHLFENYTDIVTFQLTRGTSSERYLPTKFIVIINIFWSEISSELKG